MLIPRGPNQEPKIIFVFDVKTSLATLLSEKFPQGALRSIIGTSRSVFGAWAVIGAGPIESRSVIGSFTLCNSHSVPRSVNGTQSNRNFKRRGRETGKIKIGNLTVGIHNTT